MGEVMADTAPFSEAFQQRFHPEDVDGVTILRGRGRLTAEQFEDLRRELEGARRAGWRGMVCDVQDMGDAADIMQQLGDLVQCYVALTSAGTIFNFLHAARLMRHWGPNVMPSRPPFFESQADAIADVRTRCAASR